MLIIAIVVATILLWLMLWLATGWIVSKSYAQNKKVLLLVAALILVIVVPILAGLVAVVLNAIGNGIASLRNLIDGGGANMVGVLVSVISFLLFMIILRLIVGLDWKDTTWVSLIGLFLLYCLYSFFPELILWGGF